MQEGRPSEVAPDHREATVTDDLSIHPDLRVREEQDGGDWIQPRRLTAAEQIPGGGGG